MMTTSAMAAPVVINDNYTGQDTDYAPNSTLDVIGSPAFDLDHFVVDLAAGTVAVYGEYIKHVFDPSVNLGTTIGDLFYTPGNYNPVTPTSNDNSTNGQGWIYATSYNGPLSTSGTFSLYALFSPISYTLSSFSNSDPAAFRNGQEVAVNRDTSQRYMFFTGHYTIDTTNGILTFIFPNPLFQLTPVAGFRITQTSANDVLEGGVPAAVPEPTSMMLLGTGLVGLAGMVRRRLRA